MGIVTTSHIRSSVGVLRQRLHVLRWLLPIAMATLVVLYELGPARWLTDRFGLAAHTWGEVAVFGTAGPLMAYIVLEFFGRWLDERDTSDLQARLMVEARADVSHSRALVDDAVQGLFSAGAVIGALQVEAEKQGVDMSTIPVAEAQRALQVIVGDLRAHLQETPKWVGEREARS